MSEMNPGIKERANLYDNLESFVPGSSEKQAFTLPMERFVADSGRDFIGSLRLSANPGLTAIGFFKRSFQQIRHLGRMPEHKTYQAWLALPKSEALARAEHQGPLDDEAILSLASVYDPAIVVVRGLERSRISHFADMDHIPRDYSRLVMAYDVALSSIHNAVSLRTMPASGSDVTPADTRMAG